jgi:hypothetical protein
LLHGRRREPDVAAFARDLAIAALPRRHQVGDAESGAHAQHDARVAGGRLARLDGDHLARAHPRDAVGGGYQVVHDAHLRNQEPARDLVAVHDPGAARHLHAVALERAGDAEHGRGDALVARTMAVPLAEEGGQDRAKILGVARSVAPRLRRDPALGAQFADFQQNLGRADVAREDHACPNR